MEKPRPIAWEVLLLLLSAIALVGNKKTTRVLLPLLPLQSEIAQVLLEKDAHSSFSSKNKKK